MKPPSREAWIVKFFPTIYSVTQELPELRAIADTARPMASCFTVSTLCLAVMDWTGTTYPCLQWPPVHAVDARDNPWVLKPTSLTSYRMLNNRVECHLLNAYDIPHLAIMVFKRS
jgi:hypothetical protein